MPYRLGMVNCDIVRLNLLFRQAQWQLTDQIYTASANQTKTADGESNS